MLNRIKLIIVRPLANKEAGTWIVAMQFRYQDSVWWKIHWQCIWYYSCKLEISIYNRFQDIDAGWLRSSEPCDISDSSLMEILLLVFSKLLLSPPLHFFC